MPRTYIARLILLTDVLHCRLSVIPIMRPFVWQGLFIPILPHVLADYLEAPVPFVVGIQRQPIGLRPDLLVVLLDSNKILTMGGDKIPEANKLCECFFILVQLFIWSRSGYLT